MVPNSSSTVVGTLVLERVAVLKPCPNEERNRLNVVADEGCVADSEASKVLEDWRREDVVVVEFAVNLSLLRCNEAIWRGSNICDFEVSGSATATMCDPHV